jgi:ubiquinone biosynthesis protein UbiJ
MVRQRLILLTNHVLSREPVAMDRLRPHAGRSLQIVPTGVPRFLSEWPTWTLRVTPAGLLEDRDEPPSNGGVDLLLRIDVSTPSRWIGALAGGERPAVVVEGDAALAADVSWMVDHVRWDIEADLAQWFGPAVAHELARIGRAVADALRRGVAAVEAAVR